MELLTAARISRLAEFIAATDFGSTQALGAPTVSIDPRHAIFFSVLWAEVKGFVINQVTDQAEKIERAIKAWVLSDDELESQLNSIWDYYGDGQFFLHLHLTFAIHLTAGH